MNKALAVRARSTHAVQAHQQNVLSGETNIMSCISRGMFKGGETPSFSETEFHPLALIARLQRNNFRRC